MSQETNRKRRPRKLTVYLFNVGQGDNILIRLPNNEYGIIDFYYDPNLYLTEPPALTYLKKVRRRLKAEKPIVLSFVCISHPDYDHVKGSSDLFKWIRDKKNNTHLKSLWLFAGTIFHEFIDQYNQYAYGNHKSDSTNKASAVSRELQAVLKFRDRRNTHVEFLQDIKKLPADLGGEMKVVTIAPLGKHVQRFNKRTLRHFIHFTLKEERIGREEQNLLSSVLMMIYGRHRLFFGGDTGSRIWQECIKQYDEGKYADEFGELTGNFVKASHHGSMHSSAEDIWTRILDPEGRVGISAGNGYEHPHRETLIQINGVLDPNADENRLVPRIVATNSCNVCVTKHHLDKRIFEWFFSKRPSLHDDVEEQFDADRPLDAKLMAAEPVECDPAKTVRPMILVTYIFQFEPDAEISIYKGISYRMRAQKECQYRTETSDPFPHCALQAGGEAVTST